LLDRSRDSFARIDERRRALRLLADPRVEVGLFEDEPSPEFTLIVT
jgi:hypothetical protein